MHDAHFVVKHAGGESHFRINQRRHGGTWVLLGRTALDLRPFLVYDVDVHEAPHRP